MLWWGVLCVLWWWRVFWGFFCNCKIPIQKHWINKSLQDLNSLLNTASSNPYAEIWMHKIHFRYWTYYTHVFFLLNFFLKDITSWQGEAKYVDFFFIISSVSQRLFSDLKVSSSFCISSAVLPCLSSVSSWLLPPFVVQKILSLQLSIRF